MAKKRKKVTDDGLPFSKYKQAQANITDNPTALHKGTEAELQEMCETYLKENKIPYIRIPDYVYQKAGCKALCGIPDIMVLQRRNNYVCAMLPVELKSGLGTLRQGQRNFAKKLCVNVIRSYVDFKDLVTNFLNGELE